MACEKLKQKIHDTLKAGYFSDSKDFVDVSDGSADHGHIVIVSRKFNGHTMGDRTDIIWDQLEKIFHERNGDMCSFPSVCCLKKFRFGN